MTVKRSQKLTSHYFRLTKIKEIKHKLPKMKS